MGLIPRGSLAFCGYFHTPTLKFHSPTGVDLGQPASAPVEPGAGVDGIVATSLGRVGTIGGSTPHFGTTGVGIWNSDFTVHAEGVQTPVGLGNQAAVSSARDDHGYFYGAKRASYFYRYAEDGSATRYGPVAHATNLQRIAVNGAGTIAYYSDAFTNTDKIYAYDMVGAADLGLFKTKAGYALQGNNSLVALGDGSVLAGWKKVGDVGVVEHYNAAGALLGSYTPPGTRPAPIQLTRGLTDATIWISFFGDAATATGVTASEIDLATYTVVPGHSFDPDDGAGFEYDGAFTVLLVGLGAPDPVPPVPPPTSLEPRTPCEPQTTVGNGGHGASGCNTGGVGTVAAYTGPRATAHVHADPVDGELLTGKGELDVWVELVHTDYPTGVVTTYRRAMAELADLPSYYGGRKPAGLLSIGQIEHGLSNEQGGMEAATVDLQFSDADDRLWRTLLEDQNLDGDELRVLIASPAARASA